MVFYEVFNYQKNTTLVFVFQCVVYLRLALKVSLPESILFEQLPDVFFASEFAEDVECRVPLVICKMHKLFSIEVLFFQIEPLVNPMQLVHLFSDLSLKNFSSFLLVLRMVWV